MQAYASNITFISIKYLENIELEKHCWVKEYPPDTKLDDYVGVLAVNEMTNTQPNHHASQRERRRKTASAPWRLHLAPVRSIRSLIKSRLAPSMTPVAIGNPSAK